MITGELISRAAWSTALIVEVDVQLNAEESLRQIQDWSRLKDLYQEWRGHFSCNIQTIWSDCPLWPLPQVLSHLNPWSLVWKLTSLHFGFNSIGFKWTASLWLEKQLLVTIIHWSHGRVDNVQKDTCWSSTGKNWAVTWSRRRKAWSWRKRRQMIHCWRS